MDWLPKRLSSTCLAAAGLALLIGCNTRQDIFSSPEAVTPTGPALPNPGAAVLRVTLEPRAVMGGGSGVGTIVMSLPAAPGGTVVGLSADDGRVVVPTEVVVAEGQESLTFPFETRSTSQDGAVNIAAFTPGRTVWAPLAVWASVPMALSFVSDATDYIGQGQVQRMVPPAATFRARCFQSEIEITAQRSVIDYFTTSFGAPRGTALRVGQYENATRTAFRAPGVPGIDIFGQSRGCNQTRGRFTMHELQWNGTSSLARFRASFEQHCEGREPAIRGEIRVVDVPVSGDLAGCLR